MKRSHAVPVAAAFFIIAAVPGSSVVAAPGDAPAKAVAFFERDTGTRRVNRDVDRGSSCRTPDQFDRQAFERVGGRDTSVHVDACLVDAGGARVDRSVTFESPQNVSLVCIDPDRGGPEGAFAHDHDHDEVSDHCHLTGMSTRRGHGAGLYHLRVDNTGAPGARQVLTFCFDPEQSARRLPSEQPAGHGCADEDATSEVVIQWGEA